MRVDLRLQQIQFRLLPVKLNLHIVPNQRLHPAEHGVEPGFHLPDFISGIHFHLRVVQRIAGLAHDPGKGGQTAGDAVGQEKRKSGGRREHKHRNQDAVGDNLKILLVGNAGGGTSTSRAT